jgi:hypothetical protein
VSKSVAWTRQSSLPTYKNLALCIPIYGAPPRATYVLEQGRNHPKELKMKDSKAKTKNSKALLLDYLASVRDPEHAASLFAEDGAFELPFLRSLGVPPRHTGRREIAGLIHQLLKLYPNFAFGPDDTRVLIETPEKTFAEYVGHGRAAATGRTLHQLFTGYLVAEAGEIKLLRESFNPLAMAQAQLPHGAADIPPPGDEVHSF